LNGGLYTVQTENETLLCHAKGSFRRDGISPVAGDVVLIQQEKDTGARESGERFLIQSVLERKNVLIRPPLANLDTIFAVCAVKDPEPVLLSLDKLLSISRHNGIHTVVVFTKKELDPERAESLAKRYQNAGFDAVAVSNTNQEESRALLYPLMQGTVCAMAGASGVGKSTLINTLFPSLAAQTGKLSEKNMRGKHTTRQSTLYDVSPFLQAKAPVYLADTPGFSLLDFDRFFFMEKEDLAFSFPEFLPYLTQCKYSKCSHRKEEGCRILEKVKENVIAPSRHDSYLSLYEELSRTKSWESGKKKTKR